MFRTDDDRRRWLWLLPLAKIGDAVSRHDSECCCSNRDKPQIPEFLPPEDAPRNAVTVVWTIGRAFIVSAMCGRALHTTSTGRRTETGEQRQQPGSRSNRRPRGRTPVNSWKGTDVSAGVGWEGAWHALRQKEGGLRDRRWRARASSLIADSEWRHCRFRNDNTTHTHTHARVHTASANTQCMKAFALSRSLALLGTFLNGNRSEAGGTQGA